MGDNSTARPDRLAHWTPEQLQRFLEIRQEFFLDPTGSNKERFLEATEILQRALFDWYLTVPGKFDRMIDLVQKKIPAWTVLRREERKTLRERRFALNSAAPEIPAVEGSVSEAQWQKIFGSLGLDVREPGTFDRFLVQLDDETNPSIKFNHRYMGELLPHDNMISYFSSITGTFLNENAIIGKVSPCVTHMEKAATDWLLSLVGWDGAISAKESPDVPAQRLPTLPAPSQRYRRWEREEPTGTIVAGGTIANVSALLIARSAVFDYLLGWSGAVQVLGPRVAWDMIRTIWNKDRMLVLTSKGSHYSIRKAALQAGVAPAGVIDIAGTENPWILDGKALDQALKRVEPEDLVLAVVAIAGKTETGYVDRIAEMARSINEFPGLPNLSEVVKKMRRQESKELITQAIESLSWAEEGLKKARDSFRAAQSVLKETNRDLNFLLGRIADKSEIDDACHNRLFFHVDAAHGGGFLAVPALREGPFRGIELADTITIDGHKSFYCYYPCGGLLVRTARWAETFSTGHSAYISEEENPGAYREDLLFESYLQRRRQAQEGEPQADSTTATNSPTDLPTDLNVGATFDGNMNFEANPETEVNEDDRARLVAIHRMTRRPIPASRSELTHNPFNQYLEGSRGPQGIMQIYFNLSTLGLRGYEAILGWTTLLRSRTEEAISRGVFDIRDVTSFEEPPRKDSIVVPIAGGRFLRMSGGDCNQILLVYVPAREAKLIATASKEYWSKPGRILETVRYLWRINEHLWHEHIYANPHFTYYLGHTALELELPGIEDQGAAAAELAVLLTTWNVWTQQGKGPNRFLEEFALRISDKSLPSYAQKLFCHKIVVMHPYTDESLLGDMLRRLAFWGERSVGDVQAADQAAEFLFPDKQASVASDPPNPQIPRSRSE